MEIQIAELIGVAIGCESVDEHLNSELFFQQKLKASTTFTVCDFRGDDDALYCDFSCVAMSHTVVQ